MHLIDSYNLNCKGCFHFSPLVKDNSIYPLDEFEQDIKRLSTIFDGKFGWVHLMGGEPLLNKNIESYLEIAGKYIKKGQIDLLTNGLLLSKMNDSFFKTCRDNNIRICVTRYPIDINYSTMEEIVLQRGCIFSFFDDKTIDGSFCSMSLEKSPSISAKKRYLSCIISNACVTLERGKLYYCSAPAYVHLFNETFNETFDYSSDSISIYDNNKKEILDFLRKPHNFCKYCNLKYRDSHPVKWGYSKKEKGEWLKPENEN